MDRIIELHKKEIFAGAVPSNPIEIKNRFNLRITRFSKKKHGLKTSPLVNLLSNFLDETLSIEKSQWQLEMLVTKLLTKAGLSDAGSVSLPSITGILHGLSPKQFEDLSIDYIHLTKRCWKLLDTLRIRLNADRMSRGLTEVEDINDRDLDWAEDEKDLTCAINLIVRSPRVPQGLGIRADRYSYIF